MRGDAVPVLETRRIQVSYRTGLCFQFQDLLVGRGECLAISGRTGCGKTTLLNALFQWRFGGQVVGEACLLGQDLLNMPKPELYRRVGYLPQYAQSSLNPVLSMEMQVRHALASVATPDMPDYRLWLDRLQLRQEVLGLYPRQLSGGMRQRLCLVLALLRSPQLLVLDELSNGVDVVSLCLMEQLLQEQKRRGLSILMVSHDSGFTSRLADNTCRMGV